MGKVEVGKLKELITNQPDMAATLALGTKMVFTNNKQLGEFTSFLVAGTDEITPEILIRKSELKRFAKEVLEKL